MCWLHPQILRENRTRERAAGSKFSSEEKAVWKAKVAGFFKRTSEPLEAKRKRLKAEHRSKPRLASYHWLRSVEHSIMAVTNQGFEQYDNLPGLERVLENADQSAEEKMEIRLELSTMPAPKFLFICMDEEGKQWSSMNYMKNKLLLCVSGLRDPFHRAFNDASLAVKHSGLWATYLHSLLIYNIAWGPWQKCAWWSALKEQASDLAANLGCDDPLLLAMWDKILIDRGHVLDQPEDIRGPAARAAFVRELQYSRAFATKGDKCSISRWHSWMLAHSSWDIECHTRLMAMIAMCLVNKWEVCYEDLLEPLPHKEGHQAEGSTAKAKTAKDIRKDLDALRQKAQNTFHVATRLLADDDHVQRTRIIALGVRAEFTDFSGMQRTLKGVEGSIKYYMDATEGKWLNVFDRMIDDACDLTELGRAGFQVDFSVSALKGVSSESPIVALNDALAKDLSHLQAQLMKYRCGSMAWHTSYWPGQLVGLLKDASRQATMDELRADFEAFEACKEQRSPILSGWCKRSEFNTALMRWVVAYCKAGDWFHIRIGLRQLLESLFGGWTQSRINELANQRLRDRETRANASKLVRRCRQWQVPQKAGLIAEFERTEVQPTTQAQPPPGCLEKLFTAETTEMRKEKTKHIENVAEDMRDGMKARSEMQKRLKGILGRQDWTVHTPDSQQRLYAEAKVMRHLAEFSLWHLASEAWRAGLLPEGEIVVSESSGDAMFVVKTLDCAFIAWPAEQLAPGVWVRMKGVRKLSWRFCFDEADYKVLPSMDCSPLRLHLEGCGHNRIGRKQTGGAEDLLRWLARHGFPGCSESLLKTLYKTFGGEAPVVGNDDDSDSRTVLALGCMAAVYPEWTEDLALKALHTGFCLNNKDTSGSMQIDQTMLQDVVLPNEQSKVASYAKEVTIAKAKFDLHKKSRGALIRRFFKPAASTSGGRAARPQATPRWLPKKNARSSDVTQFLEKHKPSPAAIICDDYNGRWRLLYPDRQWRSISWTKRGYEKAVAVALHLLWSWHGEATGETPKWPLEDLALPEEAGGEA